MYSKLKKISKKPFVRNVAILATGTAAAQAINMAFAPFITRIYGPEAFGVLGVFTSMVGIIAPIAALTYPTAIVLPKSDADAKGLVRLSLYVSGIMAFLVSLILIFFNEPIVNWLQVEVIKPYLFLIPLVILFSAFLQVVKQWLIRKKQFKVTAKAGFLHALILNSAKVGIGWFSPVAVVLVFLTTIGSALHALMLTIGWKTKSDDQYSINSTETSAVKELVKTHKDFPLYRAPQTFINSISQSLPVLLLSSFFGPASAGFYTIGKTALGVPIQLIGKSVGDVFYPRIAEAGKKGENLTTLILQTTLTLLVIGILPFGLVIAFGPWIFGLVFGEEWVLAGEYARWLSLLTFVMFIDRPIIVAIPVLNLQGSFLIFEIASTLLKIIALLLGFYVFNSDILAVALYSLTGVIASIVLIFGVVIASKKFNSLNRK